MNLKTQKFKRNLRNILEFQFIEIITYGFNSVYKILSVCYNVFEKSF